ncbi:MAG: hypothetical protein OXC91_11060 [Rhodobacteraceae bacterium]|nr:hypothetical protein [Paracoccaceae bacterium]
MYSERVQFTILQPGYARETPEGLENRPCEGTIADRAFDVDRLPAELESHGIRAMMVVCGNRNPIREHGRESGATRSGTALPGSGSSGELPCGLTGR